MSLLEYQECIALFWNKTGSVYGVRVQTKNHTLMLMDSAIFDPEEGSFASAFGKGIEELIQPTTQLIIAGGSLAGSVCFDIFVPKMGLSDIKQAIQYELPRHIPCDPSEITFSYRVIDNQVENDETNKILIRVYAVLKKDWNELITEFTSSEIKIDSFLCPIMILDPLFSEIEQLYVPDIDEDFAYVKKEGASFRQMIRVDKTAELPLQPEPDVLLKQMHFEEIHGETKEEIAHFITPMIMAAYGLSKDFREGKHQMITLPRELIPERFRRLRISFFMFLFMAVALILGLGGRLWWNSWVKLHDLKAETKAVSEKIARTQVTNNKLTEFDDLIKELEEADMGNDHMSKTLHLLSKIIPKTMWLQHLSTRGTNMDISVKAPAGKQASLVSVLNKTGLFKVVNSYTKLNTDRTENIYIHLEFPGLKPKKRDE